MNDLHDTKANMKRKQQIHQNDLRQAEVIEVYRFDTHFFASEIFQYNSFMVFLLFAKRFGKFDELDILNSWFQYQHVFIPFYWRRENQN